MYLNGFYMSTKKPDNCFHVDDKHIVVAQNILFCDSKVYIAYKKFMRVESYFDYPFDSSNVCIYKVSNLDSQLRVVAVESIGHKFMCLPHCDNEFVAIPLLHTINSTFI